MKKIVHYSLEAYKYLKAPSLLASLSLLEAAFSNIDNCNQEHQRIVILITILVLVVGCIRPFRLTKK